MKPFHVMIDRPSLPKWIGRRDDTYRDHSHPSFDQWEGGRALGENSPYLEGWRTLCAKTTVKGLFPISFEIVVMGMRNVLLKARFDVPDSLSGLPIMVFHTRDLPQTPADPKYLYEVALWIYRHELGEQFDVGGERPYYPHHEH